MPNRNVFITANEIPIADEIDRDGGFVLGAQNNERGQFDLCRFRMEGIDAASAAAMSAIEDTNSQISIIKQNMPSDQESGAVVSFESDRPDVPLDRCIVTVSTVQDGTGTPSPTNVRPIVGYNAVNVYVSPDATIENADVTTVDIPSEEIGAVYRGTLDVVTGKLTVTARYMKLMGTGNEGISVYSVPRYKVKAPGFVAAAKTTKMSIVANCLETYSLGQSGTAYRICQGDSGTNYIVFNLGSSVSSVALANEWLAEHNLEIVYPLATPKVYHLTPTQVQTLLGQNYIWSDVGTIDIAYLSNIESMINSAVSFVQDAAFRNVFDPTDPDILIGQQIKGTGDISSWSNGSVSGFIPCKAGDVFIVPFYSEHFGTGSGARGVPIYNANKEYVGSVTGVLTTVDHAGSNAFLKFTITGASAAYFRVNALRVSVNSNEILTPFHANNNFMVIKGDTFPTQFIPHTGLRICTGDIHSAHEDVSNPLYGKKAVFLGDSICEAAGDALGGWPARIGRRNQMISENKGIGGSCISTVYSTGKTICTRAITTVSPDYVIFEGGTNDADRIGNITGGSIPAAFGAYAENDWGTDDASNFYGFDINTFCGGFEYLCKRLVTEYAGAKVGYIVAQKMGSGTNYRNRRAYFEHAMAMCRKWGIPYLNLWDGCYLNPANSAHYISGSDGSMYIDGQHLTAKGYDYITPMIAAWMKTL